ncbi:unnamed protein product [Peniophora sp. CBMAI 1063]|nr:unnamed protein product [Peniophora sp. CBMAI 1063]
MPPIYFDRGYGDRLLPLPRTLNGFVSMLQDHVRALGSVRVHQEMRIVYRKRMAPGGRKKVIRDARAAQVALEAELMREDGAVPEWAQLVAAHIINDLGSGYDGYDNGEGKGGGGERECKDGGENESKAGGESEGTDEGDSKMEHDGDDESPIIGVSSFSMDDGLIDEHLRRVFAWRMGDRNPEATRKGYRLRTCGDASTLLLDNLRDCILTIMASV